MDSESVAIMDARTIDEYRDMVTVIQIPSLDSEKATPVRRVYARVDYLKLWIMRSVFEDRFVAPAYLPHYVCDLDVRPLDPR